MSFNSSTVVKQQGVLHLSVMTMKGLLSLMRPLNAAITFIAIVAAGYIAGASHEVFPTLILAAASGALLASSGNIINDVRDVEIDRINKPSRAIVSGVVPKTQAVWWAGSCATIGMAFSFFVGLPTLLIAISSVLLMVAYSVRLKGIPLLGNVAVGVLTGAAFIFGGYAVGNPQAGIIPGLLACVFNIAREVVKDVEDIEGDRAGEVRTFPLRYGVTNALVLVTGLFALIVVGTCIPFLAGVYNYWYMLLVVIGVDAVLITVAVRMWRAPTKHTMGRVSMLLKADMLIGILAILIGTKT